MIASSFERSLIDEVVLTLQALPDMLVEEHWTGENRVENKQVNAQLRVTVGHKPVTILIEVKKALFPRDVRQALWQIREFESATNHTPGAEVPVWMLVSEAISPGARQMLQQERVGYYDGGGSLFLPAPGAYFYIDKPPAKAMAKSMRSVFSSRRAQVCHVLLLNHQKWFRGQELAHLAEVSPATASQVLMELERLEWVIAEGLGPNKKRRVQAPGAVLQHWIQHLALMRPPVFRRYFVPLLNVEQPQEPMGRIFHLHAVPYVISFEAAAQRYASFLSGLSQVRCRMMPGRAADAALSELGALAVNEGGNFAVTDAISSGDLVFRERIDGLWLASPIQVYIDLLRGEGRSREMAEHLRKERIGF
jgi:hypothetical protein